MFNAAKRQLGAGPARLPPRVNFQNNEHSIIKPKSLLSLKS